jgi:glycosyltransferase involved in cell wall biosynthesis
MKKKILVIIPGFKHGGTNRSLYNLLSIIDKDKYDIDIFGMSSKGYYRDLFKNHKILAGSFLVYALMSNLNEEKNLTKILYATVKIVKKTLSIFKIDLKQIIYKIVSKKKQFQQYDTIIAFQEGEATLFASYTECKNKIGWIHCNYQEYLKYLNIKPEKGLYCKFDTIVCVSKYTQQLFASLLPELRDKVVAIHNSLDTGTVKEQATKERVPIVFDKKMFTIISVGRIDISKRFSAIPEIIFKLKKEGLVLKWILIGGVSHPEEELIFLKNIQKYKVQDYISYLGEVNNPYPYIANSDLLVSTSISEAFPYVLIEAKALGVPVLVTNFGSAEECVIQNVEGVITPIEKMANELENLITDEVFYTSLKSNLSNFQYDNDLILSKLYNIL